MLWERAGQGAVLGLLSVLVLVLLTAGLVDLARLWEYRVWGYRVAESAALAGLANSRDYAAYMSTGELTLNTGVAQADTVNALLASLATRPELADIVYLVRVHANAAEVVYPGYPPVAQAGMVSGDWTPDSPAVGVYLEFAVQPVLYGWVNGQQTIPLHVFAAAGIVQD